jgi:hypothetical protein
MSDDRAKLAKWSHWSNIISTEVWKAVALSFNVEPATVPEVDFDWHEDPFAECQDDFKERLDIACNHIENGVLRADGSSRFTWFRKVKLLEFGNWAVDREWNLPAQFPCRVNPNAKPKQNVATPAQRQSGTTTTTSGDETRIPNIAPHDLEMFLKTNEQDTEGKLLAAAQSEFPDKHIPRKTLRDAIEKLWGRPGREGRPKSS